MYREGNWAPTYSTFQVKGLRNKDSNFFMFQCSSNLTLKSSAVLVFTTFDGNEFQSFMIRTENDL